jgi:hypothetical protein
MAAGSSFEFCRISARISTAFGTSLLKDLA